jgi:hypothetical protein
MMMLYKTLLLFLSFLYVIILIIVVIYQLYETYDLKPHLRCLYKDGYKVFSNDDKKEVLQSLPHGYKFLNYKYTIKGCTIATFHRDITSSQYIYKTKHPVYTYITYMNDGDLLCLCPGSHLSTPLSFNNPVIVTGKPNTSILFNCDIIHAGAINKFGKNRHAIQLKICHIDDIQILEHLNDIDKTTLGVCNNSNDLYVYFLRKISLLFPFIFNHLLTNILQEKPKKDTLIEYIIDHLYIGDFYLY